MHYLILRWNADTLKYEVIFYTHDIDNFDQFALKYPEKDGYIHAIPLSWMEKHEIMKRMQLIRDRVKSNG